MRNASELRIVVDEDLEALLDALGLLEGVTNGSIACRHCARPLSTSEIALIVALEGGYELVCNSPACSELEHLLHHENDESE